MDHLINALDLRVIAEGVPIDIGPTLGDLLTQEMSLWDERGYAEATGDSARLMVLQEVEEHLHVEIDARKRVLDYVYDKSEYHLRALVIAQRGISPEEAMSEMYLNSGIAFPYSDVEVTHPVS